MRYVRQPVRLMFPLIALLVTALMTVPATTSSASPAQSAAVDLPSIVAIPGAKLAHPGVGQNQQQLEAVRNHVLAGDQPWRGYYDEFSRTSYASKNYVIANDANPGSPALTPKYGYQNYNTGFFNNQMTSDAKAAYYQAILYYLTGDIAYRAKAVRIVRLWSLLDPSKATAVVDAHIQQGPPMYWMNAAADLLRSTSSTDPALVWTQQDTDNYATNFIEPPLRLYMHRNNYWFNQQQTAIMATMSAYIFTDDEAGYHEQVEWFTVNSTVPAASAYSNGSLANAIFDVDTDWTGQRLSKPETVVKEMVRDQPHASGNIQGITMIARMVYAQNTRVDPVAGTPSTATNAVGIYDFKDDRILKGADFWSQYNLGYLAPFNDGRNAPLSDFARGRNYNYPELYYQYRYAQGRPDTDPELKYLAEAFWRSSIATDETWLAIPDAAAGSPLPTVAAEATAGPGPFQIETRYTPLTPGTTVHSEAGTAFVRATAGVVGPQFAVINQYNWRAGTIAVRVRTNGIATLQLRRDAGTLPFKSVALPDTGGEWKYVTFTMADVPNGLFPADIQIMYWSVAGAGTVADFDQMLANSTTVTPPTFAAGATAQTAIGYVGGPVALTLKATDTNATETIHYSLAGAPAGAAIDQSGAFTWTPTTVGTYKFAVQATDGTVITTLSTTLTITADYASAISATVKPYNAADLYVAASLASYQSAQEAAEAATGDERGLALLALQAAVKQLQLLTPRLSDGSLNFAGLTTPKPASVAVANLTDGDPTSFSGDLWIADDKALVLDFGVGFQIAADAFKVAPRAGFTARTAGMVVFGSNDGRTWTQLTDLAADTAALQALPVATQYRTTRFRFLRLKDIDGGAGNRGQVVEDQPFSLSEFRIVGTRTETISKLAAVWLSSSGPMADRASTGDTVTLSLSSTEPISNVLVKMAGSAATTTGSPDGKTWTSRYPVGAQTPAGPVAFSIDYTTAAGTDATTAFFTTNGSTVLASPSNDAIDDVLGKAAVSVSSGSFTTGSAATLFDNALSHTEFRLNGSGSGAWITFDFAKTDPQAAVKLSRLEFTARPNFAGRVAGTYAQGSNDNQNWTNLTGQGVTSATWQSLAVSTAQQQRKYRYVRVINSGAWFGNLAELRFFGSYGTTLTDQPVGYSIKVTSEAAAEGTVAVGLGDTTQTGTTELTAVPSGALVTADATPKAGYTFGYWTQKKVVDGVTVDYAASAYPVFNPGYFTGGYLGGSRIPEVVESWDLTAHFVPIATGDVPSTPTAAKATTGDRAAAVTWKAPVNNGGQAVTGYIATATPGYSTCTTTGATTCRIDGLTNGISYTFRVAALNAIGTGAPSYPSAAATPSDPPSSEALSLTVSASSSCRKGQAVVAVHILNKEDKAVSLQVDTALGGQAVPRLGSGKSTQLIFTGTAPLPPSLAIVTATQAEPMPQATTYQAGYQALYSCAVPSPRKSTRSEGGRKDTRSRQSD